MIAGSLPYPITSHFAGDTESPPIQPNSSTATQLDSINVETHDLTHESASTTANVHPSSEQDQQIIHEHVLPRLRDTPQPETSYRQAQRLSKSMHHVYY